MRIKGWKYILDAPITTGNLGNYSNLIRRQGFTAEFYKHFPLELAPLIDMYMGSLERGALPPHSLKL